MPYGTTPLSLPNLLLYAEHQDRMNMEEREIRRNALRLAREREQVFAHHAYTPISTPPLGPHPRGHDLLDEEYEELFGPRPTRIANYNSWGRGPSQVTNEEFEAVFGAPRPYIHHLSENPSSPDPWSLNPHTSPSSGFDVNPIKTTPWSHNE